MTDLDTKLRFSPLTSALWSDFETLFGEHGAFGGCWCMFWRLPRRIFRAGCGGENRVQMKALVEAGHVPGIVGFSGNEAVGWCSIAPREHFASLERSRIYKRVDDQPVWSITCFFAREDFRGKGIMRSLITGAENFARENGAHTIEAYPDIPCRHTKPGEMYMGSLNTFLAIGYQVIQSNASWSIVRKKI